MSELNGSSRIQDGSAEGLIQFLDYVMAKGYGPPSAVNPWKSAVKQVFQTLHGSENYGDVDVRELDLDDYLDRFETLARPKIKVESVHAYRRRFTNAVEAYLAFIREGKPPMFRQGQRRPKAEASPDVPERRRARSSSAAAEPAGAAAPQAGDRMIEYPFPLTSGQVAILRLPVRFERTDAERLGAFIRTLVLEPQRELTQGREEAGPEAE